MGGSCGALVRLLIGCVFICCCVVHVNGCVEEERRALLDIKHSLDLVGYNSSVPEHWVIGGGDCCDWTGVTCGNSSYQYKVIAINLDDVREGFSTVWYPNASHFGRFMELKELRLSNNGIAGWVDPQGFWDLKNLDYLVLNENHIKRIDWISNISSLKTIYLVSNMIKEFQSGFWGMQNLEQLFLASNDIERIEPWISNITSLQVIDLPFNMIKEFPSGLCQIQNLIEISLMENLIVGNIDTCLRSLYSLEWLDLSDNQLDGVFSFSLFANLSNLSGVLLSNNYQLEVETESPSWVPSFQLKFLSLKNCLLNKNSGRVPSFLFTQYNLEELDLSNSSIIVSNPFELINNVTYALILVQNTFHNPLLWTIQNKSLSLKILDLSESHISGIFPQNLTIFFPNLHYLNLSGNAFQGSIPSSLGVPKSIIVLDLSRNNFIGDMLPGNSNLPHIEYLSLHDNYLIGSISKSLLNCSSLKILDVRNNFLSDAIPIWLFDLPNVISLFLSRNNFKGFIPTQMCHLQNLHILDLSYNNLLGIIPSCLNNITFWTRPPPRYFSFYYNFINTASGKGVSIDLVTKGRQYNFKGDPLSLMTAIDLSMNMLSGPIPIEMGYLRMLHSLNLSYNHLTGSIPKSFQNLMSLESLDLSFNHLSSEIPPQLAQLNALSTFRVAYNNLSGIIPSDGQFSTFNESNFEGNPNLCGPVVGRSCSNGTSQTHRITDDEVDKPRVIDSPVIYYSFIAASYAIGFWGVIAVLAFKENWRVKFFLAADDLIDACGTGISSLARCIRKCIRK